MPASPSRISRSGLLAGAAASAFIGIIVSSPAIAQGVTNADEEEIIVTGSRLGRRSQEAPTPVTVLSEEDINNLALTSASEVLQELPQNSAFTGTQNVGAGNFNIGTSLANLRGLNPFFGTRTLTMVNTRRHVPTTNSGAVDLNAVPSVLIQSVETVTGGASAVYGSEAIAGVVNIILDTELEGLKGQVDFGITDRGDGDEFHAGFAYGLTFGGGRGHLMIGAEYNKADEIRCDSSRATCSDNSNVFVNANYLTNGQPHYILGDNSRFYNSNNGIFPFLNQQFNAAGTALVPFVPGQYADPFQFGRGQMQGGADATQDQFADVSLRPESERYTALVHAKYEFSDSLTGWIEGSYYRNNATNRQTQSGASLFFNSIQPDNAYLSPASADLLGFLPPFLRAFSTNGQELPARTNDTQVEVWTIATGLEGNITDNWTWDAYYSYGNNRVHQQVDNLKSNLFFAYALDAIDNPATVAFDPICRVTLSNPTSLLAGQGCVPINMFGANNVTPTAFGYAYRSLVQDETYEQHVVAGNVRGDLFDGWGAGPVRLAVGAEYRNESLVNTHDLANHPWYSTLELSYGEEFSGNLDAMEGFLELGVPILKDLPLVQALVFDGAIRQSHYENASPTSGTSREVDFTTWKLSGIWEINDWLRIRATRSRDVRAPSFYELYARSIVSGGFFGQVTNPWAGNAPQAVTATLGGASTDLGVEKADTWTLGAVFNGQQALSGFYASVDWYEIGLDGPISTLGSAQAVVNACYNEGTFCDALTGTGPVTGGGFTTISTVGVNYQNLGSYKTRGVDFELGYSLPLSGSSRLSARGIASYLYDLIIDYGTGAPVRDNAGISGPTSAFGYFNTSPEWQGNVFLTYSDDIFTGTVQARYIGSGKLALLNGTTGQPYVAPGDPGYSTTDINSINTNSVDSAIYINLNASVKIRTGGGPDDGFELFANVSNLFDKDAPPAPGGNGYGTNPVYFDTFGRSYRLGARVRF
ncbi:TonB-dependent receptor plug domain-containing protein [Tsuneonella sp. HG222]